MYSFSVNPAPLLSLQRLYVIGVVSIVITIDVVLVCNTVIKSTPESPVQSPNSKVMAKEVDEGWGGVYGGLGGVTITWLE